MQDKKMSTIKYLLKLDYSVCDKADHDYDAGEKDYREYVYEDYIGSFAKENLTPPKVIIEKEITEGSPFGEFNYITIETFEYVHMGYILTLDIDIPKNSVVDCIFSTGISSDYDEITGDDGGLLIKLPEYGTRFVRLSIPNILNSSAFIADSIAPIEFFKNGKSEIIDSFITLHVDDSEGAFLARKDCPENIINLTKELMLTKNDGWFSEMYIDFQTY